MSPFSIRRRLQSFGFAIQGAKILLSTQHNTWIHSLATVVAAAGGLVFRVTRQEWALLAFAIALVWMAEALNTAIELLADEISPEKRERIGKAKDIAAFAVLVAAIASMAIGTIVFLPHILPVH